MQKTAYEMRISDWSSDVCSSDLISPLELSLERVVHHRRPQAHRDYVHDPGADHVPARLCRRDHDALAAGNGLRPGGGISDPPSLCSGVPRARGDSALFLRAAVHHPLYELYCHAPTRPSTTKRD